MARNKGFTLIELIIVIAIIGILTFVIMPKIGEFIKRANENVCRANRNQVERLYHIYLNNKKLEHSDVLFDEFLDNFENVCPKDGAITYIEDEVRCTLHSDEKEDESSGDEVPWL